MDMRQLIDDVRIARRVTHGGLLPSLNEISCVIAGREVVGNQQTYLLGTGAAKLSTDKIAALSAYSGLSVAYFIDTPTRPSFEAEMARIISEKGGAA